MKEIVNRRNLFKKIALNVLPIFLIVTGVIDGLASIRQDSIPSTTCNVCSSSCYNGCSGTHKGMCGTCTNACMRMCSYTCSNGCREVCKDMCEVVCTGCARTCKSNNNTSTIKTDSIKLKK